MDTRKIAALTGWLMVVTFVTSIPAYFIREVVVTYGEDQVARFEWTSGVSKDPIVSFTLTANKEAPLTMVWTDNKGGVYRQSVTIAFAAA